MSRVAPGPDVGPGAAIRQDARGPRSAPANPRPARHAPTPASLPTPQGHGEGIGRRPRRDQIFAAPPARASSRAFNTLGGDIGSSLKRTPVALATALATAAMGGTMGVSPTPRTP